MKLTFEGKMDAIIADMISALSMMGFQLVPKEDPKPVVRTVEREPLVIDDDDADAEAVERVVTAKQRGRPKKQPTPVTQPEPVATPADVKAMMEGDEGLNHAGEDPDPTEELADDPSYVQASLDSIALHKLKEETLKRLRDLYISGKGPFVRQLLAKHGHGALVFPEVDAKWFPEIKADMERGLN